MSQEESGYTCLERHHLDAAEAPLPLGFEDHVIIAFTMLWNGGTFLPLFADGPAATPDVRVPHATPVVSQVRTL